MTAQETSQTITEELPQGTGIEEEETVESNASIHNPFDPTLIRVERDVPTIDLLVSRMAHEEINLNPDFQRKGGIWSEIAQSRLIESILIRIPLPAFYVDATNEDRWLVVDGLQRLTAIKRFVVDKTLRLVGLEFLKDMENRGFDDLPRSFQRRIRETTLTIFSIQSGTPEKVKFNIFKRINTGGLPLSTQEIRNALNGDNVRALLVEMTQSKAFQRATFEAIKDARMADRECAMRFLAFSLHNPSEFTTQDFDYFINEAMKQVDQLSVLDRKKLFQRFVNAMDACYSIFGKFAFRKYYGGGRLMPINKALFEVWSVNLGRLNPVEIDYLVEHRQEVLDSFANLMSRNEVFNNAVSQGTGDPKKVRDRFGAVQTLIKKLLSAR